MWARYPRIVESTSTVPTGNGSWIVTEKIHGANFSVIASSSDVNFASRSGVLSESDNFFGFRGQGLDAYLKMRAMALFDGIFRDDTSTRDSVVIYGELCGGRYPHASVAPISDAPVQCGCWYAPGICFVGFDVAVIDHENGAVRFLHFDDARRAARDAGFHYVEPLCRGSLSDCIHFNPRFSSRIPAALGLPPLSDYDNWAEGIVVRPSHEPNPPGGAACPKGGRQLVKIKIAEFKEKQYRNEMWRLARNGCAQSVSGSSATWADSEALVRYEMLAAINEQRLQSVVSKIGRVDSTDRALCNTLFADFVTDVEEALIDDGLLVEHGDLQRRHTPLWHELNTEARKVVTAFLRAC